MDIHRCRFVPYRASAINAVAFSHPNLPTSKKLSKKITARLAIGRANGDIEIWNPLNGTWLHETTLHGAKHRSIDGLVWITDEDEELETGKTILGRSRLFSIGYTNSVTEWDLENLRVKKQASGQHGDIWCLAAQPASASGPATRRLVGGTPDGALVIYSTEEDDLRFQRVFRAHKKNVQVVCIAFQSRHIGIAGCSDSTIRVFDLRKGAVIKQMTLGRDLAGGAKEIIVWSIQCLKNGDIVSGDSTGQVCIWDGQTYSRTQRIQSHTQDVLSLAASADGSTIVSGGMDKRTVFYRESPAGPMRWTKLWHRRYHTHDVKAMATFEAKGMSVVVTGGPDATPIVAPLRKSGAEHHRTLSHLPQSVPLLSAPAARIILSWWGREIHIWSLQRQFDELLDEMDMEKDIDRQRKRLGRILIQGESDITSAAISRDGSLLVVSTDSESKAFQLRLPGPTREQLGISKVGLPDEIASRGAARVAVAPDGRWICFVQASDKVLVASVSNNGSQADGKISVDGKPLKLKRLRRDIAKHIALGGLGSYDRNIVHVAFSDDGKVLAVSDLAGYIDTWVRRSPGQSLQNGATASDESDASGSSSSSDESEDDASTPSRAQWIRNPQARLLPKVPGGAVVLSFSPDTPGSIHAAQKGGGEYVLLAITSSAEIFAFHPLSGKLTPWSWRVTRAKLPVEYQNIRDLAKGVVWQGPRLWIYGASFLFMIDTSVDPTEVKSTALIAINGEKSRKRKRGPDTGAGGRMEKGALQPLHLKVEVEQDGEAKMVDVEMGDDHDAESPDDEDDSESNDEESTPDNQELVAKTNVEGSSPRRWWRTFKFRPILGVVPLGSTATPNGLENGIADGSPPLEVALVECPTWDVDTPARNAGEDNWA